MIKVISESLIAVSSCLMLALSLSLSCEVYAYSDLIIEPFESAIDEQLSLEKIEELEKCCSFTSSSVSNKKAQVSLDILFSKQDGSWMFQSIVNNGLFEIASDYQPSHPRAISITAGSVSLEQLFKRVGDSSVLKKVGDSYELYYPLIIQAGGQLIIDSDLTLISETGAAIINRGVLDISHSIISAKPSSRRKFKSFILGWEKSSTRISNSELVSLGYDGYLSGGVTVTSHSKSPGTKAGLLVIENTTLRDLYVAISANAAYIKLKQNKIIDSVKEAIDARSSTVKLVRNRITKTDKGNGIRLSNNRSQILIKNVVSQAEKSGILITGKVNQSQLIGNQLLDNKEHGLWANFLGGDKKTIILSKANIAANNGLSGIKTSCLTVCVFQSNLLVGNGRYGLTIENPSEVNQSELILFENLFKLNKFASLQAQGLNQLSLVRNEFLLDSLESKVFLGELEPYQSLIQKNLDEKKQSIKISKKREM